MDEEKARIATFKNVERVEVWADNEEYITDLSSLRDMSFDLILVSSVDGSQRVIKVRGGMGGVYGVDAKWPQPDK